MLVLFYIAQGWCGSKQVMQDITGDGGRVQVILGGCRPTGGVGGPRTGGV